MDHTQLHGWCMHMVQEMAKEGVAHLNRAFLDYQKEKYDPPTFRGYVSVLDCSCSDSDWISRFYSFVLGVRYH